MKIVLIDVDDVTLDMVPEWIKRHNRDTGESLTPDNFTDWDVRKFIKPENIDLFFSYLKDPDFYDCIPPVPGAVTAIEILAQKYLIIFVTTNRHPMQEARLDELGLLDRALHVVIEDKRYIRGDVIIDDKPDTIKNFPGHAIVFDRPWNRDLDWPYRAHNWEEALRLVEALLNATIVPGLGKDVPTDINEAGGRQSKLDYRFDLVDPLTMFALAKVLAEGASIYGLWNWRKIGERDNINHAISHLYAHLAGDTQDEHLAHAFCRVMFALSLYLTPGLCPYMIPEDVKDVKRTN